MGNEFRRLVVWSLGVAIAALAAPPVSADWTEDFAGGATHNPWVIYDNDLNQPPNASNVSYGANDMRIVGQPSASPDLFVAAIVGLDQPQYSFQNVTVRGTVFAVQNLTLAGAPALGNNDTFVIARTSATGNSGYVLALDFQSGEVDLVRSDDAEITELNASGDVPGFDPSKSYVLELVADGTDLTGRVFDAGVPVVTISTSDTTFSSGWSGVGSIINTNENLQNARTFIAAGFNDVSSIAITTPVSYDLTGDGRVTAADLGRLAVNFGKSNGATFLEGDFDVDGRVALSDLVLLRSQITPSPAAIPEPATWVTGLIGMAICLFFRRGSFTPFLSLQVPQ